MLDEKIFEAVFSISEALYRFNRLFQNDHFVRHQYYRNKILGKNRPDEFPPSNLKKVKKRKVFEDFINTNNQWVVLVTSFLAKIKIQIGI